jgi:hypothetical protein
MITPSFKPDRNAIRMVYRVCHKCRGLVLHYVGIASVARRAYTTLVSDGAQAFFERVPREQTCTCPEEPADESA